MAGMFRPAQKAANASGSEPPSRKENAERACSSTYLARSVIHSFHKPLAGEKVLEDAVERDRAVEAQAQVPLVSPPLAAGLPPCARDPPRSGGAEHPRANVMKSHRHRAALAQLNSRGKRGTEKAQSELA